MTDIKLEIQSGVLGSKTKPADPPKLTKPEIDAMYLEWRNRGVFYCRRDLSIDEWREREYSKLGKE